MYATGNYKYRFLGNTDFQGIGIIVDISTLVKYLKVRWFYPASD